jgi:pantetheine-phosphate adenylyltransferase
MIKKFKIVAVGGTFDKFHKGHRILIMKAFEFGDRVLIGLSTDEFVKKIKNQKVASYDERSKNLKKFLKKQRVLRRAKVLPLKDHYGLTLSNSCIEAIVVSKETEQRAYEINKKREFKGLPPLSIISIKMVPSENDVPISSSRIRLKEIDREGRLL